METHGVDPRVSQPATIGRKIEVSSVGCRLPEQMAGLRDVLVASTGSADQLYLALRVAAVEDSLDHGTPLPFIADDLFINFDDDRAAAGFKVLGDLAKRTQVIFFTHHQHLMAVAESAIGVYPTVTMLARDGLLDNLSGSLAAA